MKKILLLIFFILFSINVMADDKLGPDLIIENTKISPFPVEPGDTFQLLFELRNSNTKKTIKELEFSLSEIFPFYVVGEKSKLASSLGPNERVIITFEVKTDANAVPGTNNLNLIFEDNNDVRFISTSINIDVKSNTRDLSIISVNTVPEEIKPSSEIRVVVLLKNMVRVLMKDVELELDVKGDVPFTPFGGTTKKNLNSLNHNEEKEFIFNLIVDADAESKIYKVPLNLRYKDEFGNNYTVETITGLKVFSNPELKYTIESSEVHSSGKNGKVTFKIVNSGLADIKFLNIELLESDDYEIISVPNVYLGKLESDDYETAEYDIYVDSWDDQVPLNIRVSYEDAFNNKYNIDKTLTLPLYSSYKLSKFGLDGGNGVSKTISYVVFIIFVYIFIVEWKRERNIPRALKKTVMRFLVFFKKVIRLVRVRTLKRILLKIILFFKEP